MGGAQAQPTLDGCPIFPVDNIWNAPVDRLPLHPHSAAYVASIGAERSVHPDFGSGTWPPDSSSPIGILFATVPGGVPKVLPTFDYWDESDPGPYPIPADAPIEGGPDGDGDRHVLVIDRDDCVLYELYSAFPQPGGDWTAGSGAIFDLKSNGLRPSGWTSADAAGLPIFPGLVRYEEVAAGEIRHALRFTAPETRRAFVWPARHYASDRTATRYPPMGQRFRLKADFDLSGFSPETQVILKALKRYGMMLADNGSPWYLSGAPDERWDNDRLHELSEVFGSDFEAVEVSSLMVSRGSGKAWPQVAVSVEATKPNAAERGPARGWVRFARSGDLTDPLTLSYTLGGTAENGVDYLWRSGSLALAPGQATRDLAIVPIGDTLKEGSESAAVALRKRPAYAVGASDSATVTIADDD
jgi:hypothetical protein